MQDRFKFRCWNKLQNKMFYVINITWFYEEIKRIDAFESETKKIFIFDEYDQNIENTILMQCTGLKDKNGKLIFEGDVLKDKYGALHPISWNVKGFYEADTFAVAGFYNAIQEDMKVIGNIYENPELLKECEDEQLRKN